MYSKTCFPLQKRLYLWEVLDYLKCYDNYNIARVFYNLCYLVTQIMYFFLTLAGKDKIECIDNDIPRLSDIEGRKMVKDSSLVCFDG